MRPLCGNVRTKTTFQEVIKLRENGWEGLPPPPVPTPKKPKPAGEGRKDPSVTSVPISLGLPKDDPGREIPQSPLPESATVETDTLPTSPSDSILSLALSSADNSDDGSSFDPTAITLHNVFYLEDGNVEVLCGRILFRVHSSVLSFHSPVLQRMFARASLTSAESPNGCPRVSSSDTPRDFTTLLEMIYLPMYAAVAMLRTVVLTVSVQRSPEQNTIPDFATFSSLLRVTAKYNLPVIRSHLLEVVRSAYPETFDELTPSKPLGENVFSGPSPHPNEVLNLFFQQKLTSALPMAYYMAVRTGLGSLMNRSLPKGATLPPDVLQSAIAGLMTLRELELNEIHRLIFEPKGSRPCFTSKCPSRTPTDSATLDAYRKVYDHIVGSSQLRTKVLQVPEFYEDCGGDRRWVGREICRNCVERWESGHAELRKKAWEKLPDVFGLVG